jgi:hypothetical protein
MSTVAIFSASTSTPYEPEVDDVNAELGVDHVAQRLEDVLDLLGDCLGFVSHRVPP